MNWSHNRFSDKVIGLVIPTVLFVLCFVLRILFVTSQDICIDEPYSIYHAQMSLSDIIRFLSQTNNPPLFEILLHFWIKLFGFSVFSLRFLPVLFGSLTVIWIYKIGIRFFCFEVGLCAALLYTFSTHAIYYAHDCRVYTALLLFSTVSMYYTLKIIKEEKSRLNTIAWTLVNILLIYSHYMGFILLFFEVVAILFFARGQFKLIISACTVMFLCYLPHILIFIERFLAVGAEGTYMRDPVSLESLYVVFWKFSNMPVPAVICLSIIVIAAMQFLIRTRGNKPTGKNVPATIIYLVFFGSFFLMLGVSFKVHVFNGRYLFFLLPFYYLCIAIMISYLFKNSRVKWISVGIIILLFGITMDLNPSKKREARAIVEYVKKTKKSDDLIIICTHEFLTNFVYYYDFNMFGITGESEYGALEMALHNKNIYPIKSIKEIPSQLLNNSQRIIFLDATADFSHPGNNILPALQNKLKLDVQKTFDDAFKVYTFIQ